MKLIRSEDALRAKYEKLLLERDALRKEAGGCLTLYLREFGGLIAQVFQKKVDCITQKKSIAYCQMAANRGRMVDAGALRQFVDEAMRQYRSELAQLISDCESSRSAKAVPEHVALAVKSLYRKIAKRIHPDLNPALGGREVFAELWARVAQAYARNDLQEMQCLEVLVHRALDSAGAPAEPLVLPNLPERIAALTAQIGDIVRTDPYQYRYLLADQGAVAAKKEELQQELETYTAYEQELKAVLREFLKNGVIVQWPEN